MDVVLTVLDGINQRPIKSHQMLGCRCIKLKVSLLCQVIDQIVDCAGIITDTGLMGAMS